MTPLAHFELVHDTARKGAAEACATMPPGTVVEFREKKRSGSQNDAMWPALRDFARQVEWHVTLPDGRQVRADEYDWKDILTAAFERETRMAPGLRGGLVMLGAKTSKYGKRKMADFLTFLHAEGGERGVRWSEKADAEFRRYGVSA